MAEAFLRLNQLTRTFGGLTAVDGVSLEVPEGLIFGLIGPNGAGKTTLFNVVSGFLPPSSGNATLEGRRLTGLPQHQVAARGVARTFQNLQVFGSMSVLDNVLTGAHRQGHRGLLSAMFRLPGQHAEERSLRDQAHAALEFVGLADHQDEPAANLPPGQQRLLEIARALALKPRLLLLDEPAAGLTTRETETLGELIQRIAGTGLTTFLIEHDMSLVMNVCQRVAVLEQGRLLAVDTPKGIQANAAVVAAYLGEEEPEVGEDD
ncbi:MAG: ABC transporter ATP-binding protein [Armatimonadota bacterium]